MCEGSGLTVAVAERSVRRWCGWTQAMQGALMTGPALATLIQRMVEALNLRDIPSAGSMLEYFNKDLLYSVKDTYVARCSAVTPPLLHAAFTSLLRDLHPKSHTAVLTSLTHSCFCFPTHPPRDCFRRTVLADAAVD